MKPLVVIPARGGSKGVPGKNIKLLNGKPLISYTIEAAIQIFCSSEIIISTDSPAIKEVATRYGLHVPFLRPPELSTDTANTRDVLLDALKFYEAEHQPDAIVLLQPTSPFRTAQHIEGALLHYNPELDMVVSVSESKSNPYYTLFEENDLGFLEKSKPSKFLRRQDCPKIWEYNGAIYIINPGTLVEYNLHDFKRIVKYPMDELSSHDIDTQLDWMIAEQIIKLQADLNIKNV